jgi:hypothetical protein
MESKFMNLKKEYRDFIDTISSEINVMNIDEKLTRKKCNDIFNLYQRIYSSINSTSLNINDINHIMLNYNRDNSNVELIKKFIKIKNLYLIKRVINSSQWIPFISQLRETLNLEHIKLNKKKINYLISKGVYTLLKSTLEQFRGCWEIVEFKDDKIKKLEIIEPEHIDFLTKYVNTKYQEMKDDKSKFNIHN